MPTVITLDGHRGIGRPMMRNNTPRILGGAGLGNAVGDWILSQSYPVAILATLGLSAAVGLAVSFPIVGAVEHFRKGR